MKEWLKTGKIQTNETRYGYKALPTKRYNFQIIDKMSKGKKTSDKAQNGNDFIADVSGSTGVIKRQPRYSGCIYFDKSLKETRHGRHIYHNKYCAEITINNVRYRRRSKSRSVCEDFISEMRLKHLDNSNETV